jgi:hypothetical protein
MGIENLGGDGHAAQSIGVDGPDCASGGDAGAYLGTVFL